MDERFCEAIGRHAEQPCRRIGFHARARPFTSSVCSECNISERKDGEQRMANVLKVSAKPKAVERAHCRLPLCWVVDAIDGGTDLCIGISWRKQPLVGRLQLHRSAQGIIRCETMLQLIKDVIVALRIRLADHA